MEGYILNVRVTTEVEVNVTIMGYRPPTLFGGVVTFGYKRGFLVASFGVRTADAYHVRIWRSPGSNGKVRAR